MSLLLRLQSAFLRRWNLRCSYTTDMLLCLLPLFLPHKSAFQMYFQRESAGSPPDLPKKPAFPDWHLHEQHRCPLLKYLHWPKTKPSSQFPSFYPSDCLWNILRGILHCTCMLPEIWFVYSSYALHSFFIIVTKILQYCFNSHRDHYSTSRHTTSNLLYDASRQPAETTKKPPVTGAFCCIAHRNWFRFMNISPLQRLLFCCKNHKLCKLCAAS